MRDGLEEMFQQETAELFDKNRPYAVRVLKWRRLIQLQEAVVRGNTDGSIASPVDPEHIKDTAEYLERLKQLKVPL